jgi:hypothetical protein
VADQDARALPERLATLLVQAAGQWQATIRNRRESLESRKTELTSISTQPARLDELRSRAAELAAAAETRRRELAEEARAREELHQEEERLAAQVEAAHDRLRARCADLVASLPLLASSGGAGWISWLEDWYQRHGRPFEPAADWHEDLLSRRVVDDALAQIEPILRQVHELEVASDVMGIARVVLPAEIDREQAQVHQLDADLTSRARQVGSRYGRILEDLPQPPTNGSVVQLQQIEGLLTHLEATLSRFAASVALERQMLEALQ